MAVRFQVNPGMPTQYAMDDSGWGHQQRYQAPSVPPGLEQEASSLFAFGSDGFPTFPSGVSFNDGQRGRPYKPFDERFGDDKLASKSLPTSRRNSFSKQDVYEELQNHPAANSIIGQLLTQSQKSFSITPVESPQPTKPIKTVPKLPVQRPVEEKPSYASRKMSTEILAALGKRRDSDSVPPQFSDDFMREDDAMEVGSPVINSIHLKQYLHKITTDRTLFPVLLRRDSIPGMLSASSAALDLAPLPQTRRASVINDKLQREAIRAATESARVPETEEESSPEPEEKNSPAINKILKKGLSLDFHPDQSSEDWDHVQDPRSTCKFFLQGFCSRGDRCKYSHQIQPLGPEPSNQVPPTSSSPVSNSSTGSNSASNLSQVSNESATKTPKATSPKSKAHKRSGSAELFRFPPLDQISTEIYELCKDQHGCRYLQKKLEDGKEEDIQIIFDQVYEHLLELMADPFGNYLCQKLFAHCNDKQRTLISHKVSPGVVQVSLNMHGTRSVQKLIDSFTLDEQVNVIVDALRNNVVLLIKDLNGNHVVQKCLNRLRADQNQFIYDSVTENCVIVASHRHGCCVMQRCVDHASPDQKAQLAREITNNALTLVQDAFGNYVVQYILDLNIQEFSDALVKKFYGHVFRLSLQKFSSNVIEKCIRVSPDYIRRELIQNLVDAEKISSMIQDPYANYVLQTTLEVADNDQHVLLAEIIKPILPAIRHLPYAKRIQSKLTRETKSK